MTSEHRVCSQMDALVKVKDLYVEIDTGERRVYAVNGVSFEICPGEFLAIVGESGCGKSLTAMSILGLTREIPGAKLSGQILFRTKNSSLINSPAQGGSSNSYIDMLSVNARLLQRIRGKEIGIIFQDPISSLNPLFTVGDQIMEPLRLHMRLSPKEARKEAIRLLKIVGIDEPENRFHQYPHQLSGGMCQRVMIAMALSTSPSLLIADEPTTALDVTIQAQILHLLLRLKREFNSAVLLITHNLAIVAGTASRVIVMYAGKIVEATTVKEFFKHPHHPYSNALLRSLPRIDVESELVSIPGQPPDGSEPVRSCPYAPRCERAQKLCYETMPPLVEIDSSLTACYFPY